MPIFNIYGRREDRSVTVNAYARRLRQRYPKLTAAEAKRIADRKAKF